jgi:hypothetical protein
VMPLVRGDPGEREDDPVGRVRNTRKLLVCAALIMSVLLLGSSLAISTLIPPEHLVPVKPGTTERIELEEGMKKPPAKDRALAYLAHNEGPHKIAPFFGNAFGTVYDITTIIILWFAGASAMAGLLNLVPKYLPRYGMAPEWASAVRPLVFLFTGVNLLVTWIFKASVDDQGGAYATGVLVLITSACVATVIERYRAREGGWAARVPWGYAAILAVFTYTTVAVMIEKPEGLKIAAFFIAAIVITSVWSRLSRARELRFSGFRYADPESKFLWETIKHLEFQILVPHRPGRRSLASKEAAIRSEHRLPPESPILFLEVRISDASEFNQMPLLKVIQEEGRFIMQITQAASIAHTLAAVALDLSKVGKPPEIHFGWTDQSPMAGTLGFLLFGEGNVPWLVRDLMHRAEPDASRRPPVVIAGP